MDEIAPALRGSIYICKSIIASQRPPARRRRYRNRPRISPSRLSNRPHPGTNIGFDFLLLVPLHPFTEDRAHVKFVLVDHLISLEPGKRIVMAKNVSMAEEYLADHFPGFPVLPGVLMLEAAIQTAAWLVRSGSDFAHSLVVLREVRGVRYGTFVSPGQTLTITADAVEIGPARSDFKIKGTVGGATAVQARLELAHLNLADTDPALKPIDTLAINAQRDRWQIFTQRNAAAQPAPGTLA
jgi:3-hydroxyacyl-[acyl-carrier-protein] dehydratase